MFVYVVVTSPAAQDSASVLLALPPESLPLKYALMVAIKITVSSTDTA